jgi:hypothetical protein
MSKFYHEYDNAIYDMRKHVGAVNVIPQTWYKKITFENGKPHLNAITILSELVYWYTPHGKVINGSSVLVKKFSADILQKGYRELSDKFGMSDKQVREALIKLESMGLAKRIFRSIDLPSTKLTNVMFISIDPIAISSVSASEICDENLAENDDSGKEVFPLKETPSFRRRKHPPSVEGNTYTENTNTENTNTIINNPPTPHGGADAVKNKKSKKKNDGEVNVELVAPSSVDEKLWNDFLEMRKKIRKPATDRAKTNIIKKLEKFGQAANEALENSIVNCWADVYNPADRKSWRSKNEDDNGLGDWGYKKFWEN